MQMNSGLILASQPLNALGAIQQGNQAAAQTNAIRDQNALRALYQSQGAGIANGDAGALNALAGLDPMAAMQAKQAQQSMAFDAEKMQMLRAEAAQKAQAYAASLTAAQREAEAKKIADGISGAGYFFNKGDRAGYDAFLSQQGIDPATHPFDQFPALAAQYGGALDALKAYRDADKPANAADRFKVVGNSIVDLSAEGGPQIAMTAPTAESGTVVYDPATGNPIVTTGTAKPVKFTEAQSKDVTYATRAEGALKKLEPVASALTDRASIVADSVPLGLGREVQNSDFQVARVAGDEFLQAILRKDTGAAITSQEREEYGRVYLPQPGDTPEALTYRAEARRRALEALKAGMNPDQMLAQERALARASQPNVPSAQTGNSPQVPGQPLSDDALIQKYLGTGQ